MKNKIFQCDDELSKEIKLLAVKLGITQQQLIRLAIQDFIQKEELKELAKTIQGEPNEISL